MSTNDVIVNARSLRRVRYTSRFMFLPIDLSLYGAVLGAEMGRSHCQREVLTVAQYNYAHNATFDNPMPHRLFGC